jgi:hypothetical protein
LRLRRIRFPTCSSTCVGFFDETLFLAPRLLGARDFDFFSEGSEGIAHRGCIPVRYNQLERWKWHINS